MAELKKSGYVAKNILNMIRKLTSQSQTVLNGKKLYPVFILFVYVMNLGDELTYCFVFKD